MKRNLAFLIFVLFAFFVVAGFFYKNKNLNYFAQTQIKQDENDLKNISKNSNSAVVKIAKAIINVELAQTPKERTKGLSGRKSLEEGSGMLFVYDFPGRYTFWMPDMNFPIDIIWIDSNKKVVYIKENATPEDYPEKYTPSKYALYVLEVPSGYVKKNDIDIGSNMEIIKW